MTDYPDILFHRQILDKCKEHGDVIALKIVSQISSTDLESAFRNAFYSIHRIPNGHGDRVSFPCKSGANELRVQTDDDGDLTFNEIYDLSYRLASFLNDHEIYQGDNILVILPNCSWYPLVFLGGALIGCTLTGISEESTADEVHYTARKCDAVAVICQAKDVSKISEVIEKDKIFIICTSESVVDTNSPMISRDLPACNEKFLEFLDEIPIELDDTILMPLSSGTGGLPKCVLLTHRNYSAATAILKKALFDELVSECRRKTIAVLPFYHASGFWALLYCLLEGCHTIIMKTFHPVTMLEYVQKYKVDTLNLVPSIVSFVCRVDTNGYDLSSLRNVLCGSSSLGKGISEKFLEKFSSVRNLIQGYGMTEIVVLSHITPLGLLDDKHLGSCGKLLPGFETKLIDEVRNTINEPNKAGELYIKSPTVMLDYFNMTCEDESVIDEEGWLKTGDLMYYDDDGFYYVVGRVKDLIKVNGIQVSPSELEDVILTHPSVKEAAVIGIDHPESGQVPKAFVVLEDGADQQLTSLKIRALVAQKLSPTKQLRGGVQICAELPKTSSGKVKRSELRKLVTS